MANAVTSEEESSHSVHHSHEGPGLLAVQLLCIVCAVGLLLFVDNRDIVGTLGVFFVSIVLEAFPFVLLGALVGGVIEAFVPQEKLTKVFPATAWWTVLPAGLLGVVFPVCECAVVPVIRRLIRKGVPLSAAVTYLLAGPIVNPIVAASTAVAYKFEWPFSVDSVWFKVTALRVILGYGVAVTVGLVVGRLFRNRPALLEDVKDSGCDHGCGCDSGAPAPPSSVRHKIYHALENGVVDFLNIGRFLVLGAFVAALVQTFVPRSSLLVVSESPMLAIAVMMVMAVALNLCSEADAFVAASFRTLMPLSAQLSFMVLGPMLDIKLLFMYFGVFKKRAIVAISGSVLILVFVTMVIADLLVRDIAL